MFQRDSIALSDDVLRVAALPRRQPADEQLIQALSRTFRVRDTNDEGEPNVLREAQANALRELYECGGLFAPMRVGAGKSLPTLLAPTLMGSKAPVLFVPASLKQKTREEFAAYARNWRVRLPELISYEEMGRPDREDKLFRLRPDLMILDEAHKARNLDAAVTRRIERYKQATGTKTLTLSGTLMTPDLLDYHHLALWSLADKAPVPMQRAEAERWTKAVSDDVSILERVDTGALSMLPGGYHEWFRGSRGVVPTTGKDCDASILVEMWQPDLKPELLRTIQNVAMTKMRPDGELLDDWETPDCLCQLAQGFYYVWDPMPPDWWLKPRRAWWAYVRAILDARLQGFDSKSQIASALDNGRPIPSAAEGRQLLAAWRAVESEFIPNPKPIWLSVDPLVRAIKRAGNGCLIWTRHTAAGEMIAHLGVPYYGGGTSPATANGKTIALTYRAHGEGKNLQAWHRNLILVPPANADLWEQLVGRTHRPGQKSDTVFVDIYSPKGVEYHMDVVGRARTEAKRSTKASGFDHKLCIADWAV